MRLHSAVKWLIRACNIDLKRILLDEFLGPGTDYERVLSALKKYDNDVGRTLNHLVECQHEELSSAVSAKLKVSLEQGGTIANAKLKVSKGWEHEI